MIELVEMHVLPIVRITMMMMMMMLTVVILPAPTDGEVDGFAAIT